MPKQYTHPTPEQRQRVLTDYGELHDRLVREPEHKHMAHSQAKCTKNAM